MFGKKQLENGNVSGTGKLKEDILYAIQNKVDTLRNCRGTRREEIVMTRLRIGHSILNSTLHIIGKHPTGFCEYCQKLETIEHVVLNFRRC